MDRKIWTAAELDQLTPDERHQNFLDSIVWDLDELPSADRDRIVAWAEGVVRARESDRTD